MDAPPCGENCLPGVPIWAKKET